MKVLWFANTPCGATEKLTGHAVTSGGWLFALSEQLAKESDIELHIAFYWGEKTLTFVHKGINYHPVYREGEGSKFGRLINRWKKAHNTSIEKKDLPHLISLINEVNPDIIHIHGTEDSFGLIGSQSLNCPLVISIQGILSLYLSHYYRGFTKQEIKDNEGWMYKMLMSGVNMKELSFRRRAAMEKEYFKNIPNIIGRTFWDKAGSLALNPKRNYYEVGEILRQEFFKAHWSKKAFSTPIVLTSTISFGFYKGLESVYQTANILKGVDFPFEWKIIGMNKDDTLVNLSEKKVGKNAEELHIQLLGRMNATEMVELMTESDIFIQVSHIENSPNSLCEAMMLGMPIIATFVGGTASLLENNVEGRLLQDGEPYSMAGMIMELAADFETAKNYGVHARATALKRHNPEHVCNQLLKAYNSILE